MGIPKLYAWLVARYPLLVRSAAAFPRPHFNNLYLDLNGVLHKCTHSNEGDPLAPPKGQKEIFLEIFSYIEKLFLLVQPDQLLFIAIDGVAPRAKMNQQRQRRYRSAMSRDAASKKKQEDAAAAGIPFDATAPFFDSNCITPGTEFMQAAGEAVEYFIKEKLRDDESWKKIQVVFSGAEVPGEGEHKIAQYIRGLRSQPGYNPATSHCVYGLDADLIMLGLATHELHFSIIRERVMLQHGKRGATNDSAPQFFATHDFELLHLSLLREFLQVELGSKNASQAELDRLVDDFVFLCFLIGNDFIPCAPGFAIDERGLDQLMQTYKDLLPWLRKEHPQCPYIMDVKTSALNAVAFQKFLGNLLEKETKYLAERFSAAALEERMRKEEGEKKEEKEPAGAESQPAGAQAKASTEAPSSSAVPAPLPAALPNFLPQPPVQAQPPAPALPPDGTFPAPSEKLVPLAAFVPAATDDAHSDKPTLKESSEPAAPKGEEKRAEPASQTPTSVAEAAPAPAPLPLTLAPPASPPVATVGAAGEKKGEPVKKAKTTETASISYASALKGKEAAHKGPSSASTPLAADAKATQALKDLLHLGAPPVATAATVELKQMLNSMAKREGPETSAAAPLIASASSTLAVTNLTRNVKREHLLEIFGAYGQVSVLALRAEDAPPAAGRFVALLAYATKEQAAAAVDRMDGGEIDGAVIRVSLASSHPGPPPAASLPIPKILSKPSATSTAAADPAKVTVALKSLVETMKESDQNKENYYTVKQAKSATQGSALVPVNLVRAQLIHAYLECLHWCIYYYYRGTPSWHTFYPFFYAPLISDLKEMFSKSVAATGAYPPPAWLEKESARGEPLRPLQQLAAVIPPQSASLLPEAYRSLLSDPASPIMQFYPPSDKLEFTDDDKNREWKKLLKIPFIDAAKLVAACDAIPRDKLSAAEQQRDRFGVARVYSFSPQAKETVKPALCPLPPLSDCPFVCNEQKGDVLHIPPVPGVKVLHEPYLPSLGGVAFSTRTLQQPRMDSLVLTIETGPSHSADPDRLAQDWIGRAVAIGWPYLNLAEVLSVQTRQYHVALSRRDKVVRTDTITEAWEQLCASTRSALFNESKIELGDIHALLHVAPLEGMTLQQGAVGDRATVYSLTRSYAQESVAIPLQLVGRPTPVLENRFREHKVEQLHAIPVGGQGVVLANGPHYGALGRVKAVFSPQLVEVVVPVHPKGFADNVLSRANPNVNEKYHPAAQVAKVLSVSPLTLARVTSNLYFAPPIDLDLGLCFKYSRKRLILPGYARLARATKDKKETWEYSELALKLLRDYKSRFPQIFTAVEASGDEDSYDGTKVFGEDAARLATEAFAWKRLLRLESVPLMPADASSLSNATVAYIQKEFAPASSASAKTAILKLHPGLLYAPTFASSIHSCIHVLNTSGTKHQPFALGERVVNLSFSGVPIGLSGTVVTLYESMAEVVFDEEFLGATTLSGRLTRSCGMVVPLAALMSLSQPIRHSSLDAKPEAKPAPHAAAGSSAARNKFSVLDMDS